MSSAATHSRPPWWLTAMNQVGRLGIRRPRLDPERIRAWAEARTGLHDYGPGDLEPALGLICEALEHEAQLTTFGRLAMLTTLRDVLTSRLTLTDHRARHPEVAAQEIKRPIFIVGMPRTGTTILFELLAQDPAHRAPLTWEIARPMPPPTPESFANDPRIAEVQRNIDILERIAPKLASMHKVGSAIPQECLPILQVSLLSDLFHELAHVPSYRAWLAKQDPRPAYLWHRHYLQHLQSRCPTERWLLKTPLHLLALDALLETYPDAALVHTHRDPMTAVASFSSLLATLRGVYGSRVMKAEIGPKELEFWSRALDRNLAFRERSDARVFDLRFADFMDDALGSIERLYEFFGFELRDDVRESMRRYLAEHPRHRHGRHVYTLEDYGLDHERDGPRFDAYRERFGVPAEPPTRS